MDESFPDFQFHMKNYQFPPFRRNRNSNGGGQLVFETQVSGTICIELTITKKKRCILFAYKPHLNKKTPPFSKKSQIVLIK